MRVAFFGNNLNFGCFFVRMLRQAGFEATHICPEYRERQEHNDWWTDRSDDDNPVFRIPEIPVGCPVPLRRMKTVRRLYRHFEDYDVLVLSENGPAVFSEMAGGPNRIFFALGFDLTHLPFYLDHYLQPTRAGRFWREHLKWAFRGRGRDVYEIVRAFDRFPREIPRRWTIQKRQRAGLRLCRRIVCGPQHGEILDRLGLEREKVRYLNLPMDTSVLAEVDDPFARSVQERYADCDLVFLHPTRMYFLREDSDVFLKDNDKLLRAFARFLGRTERRARLLLFRKGREHDLLEADRIIARCGIGGAVEWLPETPNKRLRAYYRLAQLVVCDQFSPRLAVLGNIGREASYFGCPLITGFAPWNALRYGEDMPGHVFAAETEDQIVGAMEGAAALSPEQRKEMGREARAWFDRNHAEKSVMAAWSDLITSCAR